MKSFILFFMIFTSGICFADDSIFTDAAPFFLRFIERFLSPLALGWISVIGSVCFGGMIMARALSEVLAIFADKTKTDLDNKAIIVLNKLFTFSSKLVGWFGVGYSKKLL